MVDFGSSGSTRCKEREKKPRPPPLSDDPGPWAAGCIGRRPAARARECGESIDPPIHRCIDKQSVAAMWLRLCVGCVETSESTDSWVNGLLRLCPVSAYTHTHTDPTQQDSQPGLQQQLQARKQEEPQPGGSRQPWHRQRRKPVRTDTHILSSITPTHAPCLPAHPSPDRSAHQLNAHRSGRTGAWLGLIGWFVVGGGGGDRRAAGAGVPTLRRRRPPPPPPQQQRRMQRREEMG